MRPTGLLRRGIGVLLLTQDDAAARAGRQDAHLFRRILREFGRGTPHVTDEEVACFRTFPHEIDAASAPARIHRLVLLLGTLAGFALVALSKVPARTPLDHVVGAGVEEFLTDMLFEMGLALIWALLTAYLPACCWRCSGAMPAFGARTCAPRSPRTNGLKRVQLVPVSRAAGGVRRARRLPMPRWPRSGRHPRILCRPWSRRSPG